MRPAIKLFLILVTVLVILVAWITHQLENSNYQLLAGILIVTTLAAFFILNLLDHRDEIRKRKERESRSGSKPDRDPRKVKRAEGSFALKDKKSGLSWGGGNIKASQATRGTKRKFLGK
jgi:hypothetical protein